MSSITLAANAAVLARRNVEHVRQIPEKLLDVTVQPLMFTLLFAYVFGGAITVPNGSYHEYLMGGIFIQTLVFAVTGPGAAIANDLREGMVDRLRTLPIARSAYLFGHAIAEWVTMLLALLVLTLAGLLVGWRIHTGIAEAIGGFALLGLFAMAMLWLGTAIGVGVRSPDSVQGVMFVVIFPLTFISNAFVPTAGLPSVLKTIAQWNPVSALVAAVRTLFGNPVASTAGAPWPLTHPVVASVIWSVLIVAICFPLALKLSIACEPPDEYPSGNAHAHLMNARLFVVGISR